MGNPPILAFSSLIHAKGKHGGDMNLSVLMRTLWGPWELKVLIKQQGGPYGPLRPQGERSCCWDPFEGKPHDKGPRRKAKWLWAWWPLMVLRRQRGSSQRFSECECWFSIGSISLIWRRKWGPFEGQYYSGLGGLWNGWAKGPIDQSKIGGSHMLLLPIFSLVVQYIFKFRLNGDKKKHVMQH